MCNCPLVLTLYYPCPCVAEIYHFQHERAVDFREMMKLFLAEQIKFYEEVSNKYYVDISSNDVPLRLLTS